MPATSDPVSGTSLESLHLSVPAPYLVLAPWFTIWDGISMLSMSRLHGLLVGLAIFYVVWRVVRLMPSRSSGPPRRVWLGELGLLILAMGMLLGFLLVGAIWHRPMLSLAGVSPDYRVVDFHSHTTYSHDVGGTWMRGFDLSANRRWHARAGFDAVFVTDHNTVEGLRGHHAAAGEPEGHPVICPGIEVSAWRAHIVLLGDTLPVDRSRYSGSLAGLLDLLQESESAFGSLTLASLPEYRENHWNRLDTLVAAGLDGFEIVNASPKANELSRADRARVTALARARNRFVVGVSDSHGWGATSMIWNLVRVPRRTPASGWCGAVLDQLQLGFPAVGIVERHRLRPDDWWPLWLTPLGVIWETWRSMGWPLTISWLVWVWLLAGLGFLLRTRALRVNIARSTSPGPP